MARLVATIHCRKLIWVVGRILVTPAVFAAGVFPAPEFELNNRGKAGGATRYDELVTWRW